MLQQSGGTRPLCDRPRSADCLAIACRATDIEPITPIRQRGCAEAGTGGLRHTVRRLARGLDDCAGLDEGQPETLTFTPVTVETLLEVY